MKKTLTVWDVFGGLKIKKIADNLKEAKKEAKEGNGIDVFYLLEKARILAFGTGRSISKSWKKIWARYWKVLNEKLGINS
tara:strand:+ start:279 stop:518 length:240 start_codon:yes stop_codon:yes gene_type:complete